MVTTDVSAQVEQVLFALAGQQERTHPDMARTFTVLRQILTSHPPSMVALMPATFVLTSPKTPALADFQFRDAYKRSLAMAGPSQPVAYEHRRLIDVVYPRGWRELFEQLVRSDLEDLRTRLQHGIYEFAMKALLGNVRRGDGPPSRAYVDGFRIESKRLLEVLSSIVHNGRRFTKFEMPEMEKGGYITVAPPLRDLRSAFAQLNEQIRSKMGGVQDLDGEREWLLARQPVTIAGAGLVALVRNRALVAIALTTAGRAGALSRLTLADYSTDHLGPAPDYRRGPALLLRPRKKDGRWVTYWRPVPHEVGAIIDVWLLLRDAHLSLVGLPALAADAALLVGDATLSEQGSASRLTHWLNPVGGAAGPFVARRPEHRSPEIHPEDSNSPGYTMHELRHLASQQAERAGFVWEQRHPSQELSPIAGSAYASALLLNGDERKDMRALYGDRGTAAMIEVLAGRAAEVVWEFIATDAGLRRRPDVEGYASELVRLRRLEDDEQRALSRADRLQRRGTAVTAKTETSSTDTDLVLSELREVRELLTEGFGVTHALQAIHQRKEDTLKKLDVLRLDPGSWLPLSDEEPDGAERVDWTKLDAAVLGKALMPGDVAVGAVRDWLTVREFSFLADDLPRTTLTRWMKGKTLPRSKHKRPWEASAIPVDDSLGMSYRRIWVPGVNDTFWRTKTMRDHLEDLLSRWPDEQGWTKRGQPTDRCFADLDLPSGWEEPQSLTVGVR